MDIINCVPDCFSEREGTKSQGKKGMESDTH